MSSRIAFQLNLFLVSLLLSASLTTTHFLALPGCPGRCGNLSIPFPFGLTPDCYFDDSFLIICNTSFKPAKPFLQLGRAEVLNISLDGKIKILNSSSELMELEKRDRMSVPTILEWAAGNVACHVARRRNNTSGYACQSPHSKCTDSSHGRGHICQCLPGYEGNPYLLGGCQDIDECAVSNPCEDVCINLPGSFKCYCPKGFAGDGRKDGTGCHPKDRATWFVAFASSYFPIGIIALAPALVGSWILWTLKKHKLLKRRESFFEQNGGILLRRKQSKLKSPAKEQIKVYTSDDIKKATDNYSTRVAYKCKPGTFYSGRVVGNENTETKVIIMMIPRMPESQIEQFVDQLILFSQPHKNLVKIIGCCLETAKPLIVYEFYEDEAILFNHVNDEALMSSFSCEKCVKAAAAAARALEYMHSQNSRAFVHGNISSANILLDANNDAKLFYAVASNLVAQDGHSREQENYVGRDNKFFSSSQLSQKSDVYSFGEVLKELLTGWKAFVPNGHINDGNLDLNNQKTQGYTQQVKHDMAMLAERCLNNKSEGGPNMKEVEAKLSALMQLK